uniref:Uncharacterized protein n=1 Tax=Rhinopithecus roxellana TaxID=61622 RepID=A0A2K6NGF1_RHIRO
MASLSTAPSTSGELPLPASTPSNWTCSKAKTSLSHHLALVVFPLKPLPFHSFPILIFSLYCVGGADESARVEFYVFIYLSTPFLSKALKSQSKWFKQWTTGSQGFLLPPQILTPETRPDWGHLKVV